ncbi:hypothetical protein Misp01_50490 [Microtetraspora sp. NBRC 13810]|uniref:DUF302 domain-containing protein n=1 Tax=Microtetraspora sp. NBRC 13810 TaxID=3030990 RepID=UPI0024A47A30|nr:DUF302 domain-containing protein [Microtetraspora sp. NBRC 13810]GLW09920.1 hypothetical protein Misp01_50490 [Microtetraspora sp. NBRC 13810]
MSQQTTQGVRDVVHEVHQLNVDVGAPYEDFRRRYEEAVPPADLSFADRPVGWDAVLRAADENAPHGFMIYWRMDAARLMRLAGDPGRCTQYLMGNHTIAERMFRHNPAVMLYAPLRALIYEDASGTAWFAIDQPSTKFATFGDPAITPVGVELDHKLAGLLAHLDAPVPPALLRG